MNVNLQNVRISGAEMNVAVTCNMCGILFDAAPGADVVIDTVQGRLRVRDLVRAAKDLRTAARVASADDLRHFQEAASAGGDAMEALTGPFSDWWRKHPEAAQFLLDKLGDFLIALLAAWLIGHVLPSGSDSAPQPIHVDQVTVNIDHDPTDAELEQLIRDAVKEQSDPERVAVPKGAEVGASRPKSSGEQAPRQSH